MKKIAILISTFALVVTFSSFAFAETAVSQMATTKGGQAIAKCAQEMNKGVSECAKMLECVNM